MASDAFLKLREQIYSDLINRDSQKYFWFIKGLRAVKHVSKNRGEFLESFYAYMRYVDDVVDGDRPLPKGYSSKEDFINARIEVLKNPSHKKSENIDELLRNSFVTAASFKQNFVPETEDILQSMLFDAKRFGKYALFPETELYEHFFLMDIIGTIKATLKVFNENPNKYALLEPIGVASRLKYNLRDRADDFSKGIINISSENALKYGINKQSFEKGYSSEIKLWERVQAEKGIRLIEEHHENLKDAKLGIPALITLKIVYEMPAKKYFEKILNNP